MATSDLRKAAVVLLSLSKRLRTRLLTQLDPRQAAAVAAEMNRLQQVGDAERETAIREFVGDGEDRLGRRGAPRDTPLRFLHDLDIDTLLDLIADEHPQTVAFVLSCLPPRQAAAALAELPPDAQFSVVCRIATMNQPSPTVVQDVERGLQQRLSGRSATPTADNRIANVVRILNVMEPAAERRLLGDLAEADPELVRDIRRVMFGVDVAACEMPRVASAAG